MLTTSLIGGVLLGLSCSQLGIILTTKLLGDRFKYTILGWLIGMLSALIILVAINVLLRT